MYFCVFFLGACCCSYPRTVLSLEQGLMMLFKLCSRNCTDCEAGHVLMHCQELEDIEVRLRHGGLGGVPDFDRWTRKLAAASTVQQFVSTS